MTKHCRNCRQHPRKLDCPCACHPERGVVRTTCSKPAGWVLPGAVQLKRPPRTAAQREKLLAQGTWTTRSDPGAARAEREQARAEHLGELAAEREMVQAQTPVVNVEEEAPNG